jgi:hypothetical protein
MVDVVRPACSGRGCGKPSIGTFEEVHIIPEWRHPEGTPLNRRAFDLGVRVFYCAEHEQVARST